MSNDRDQFQFGHSPVSSEFIKQLDDLLLRNKQLERERIELRKENTLMRGLLLEWQTIVTDVRQRMERINTVILRTDNLSKIPPILKDLKLENNPLLK
jgi:hypothetical protein